MLLPWVTPRFFRRFGDRPSELEAKFLHDSACSGSARWPAWADSEAVLPAYLMGMVLAGTVGKDHALVRRLRTLTFGLLTPFYFIRAGSLVSLPALVAAPDGVPRAARGQDGDQGGRRLSGDARLTARRARRRMYTTLLMSTGPDLRHHLGAVRSVASGSSTRRSTPAWWPP
ncbi:MAG: hypothetical protein MZV65_22100 [Chromatiales bacterium]|nr:hypothetical protein [Chromatiales bacterium]